MNSKRNEGPLLVRAVHFHSSPPPVPRAPCDGAPQDIVGSAQLSRCHAQEWTDCSVLGAQSMHAGGGHNGVNGLRLNVSIALEAANARAGQEYQPWVRDHQPRALGSPVQALKVTSIHAAAPRRRMIEVHRVHVKYMILCSNS